MTDLEERDDDEQLVLGDLLNHVLDKGLMISGQVTISIANIDLLFLDLRLILTSVQTALERGGLRVDRGGDDDLSVLRPSAKP